MSKYILILCVLSQFMPDFASAMAAPGPRHLPTRGEVWPRPQHHKKYSTYYTFSKSIFAFVITGKKCKILETSMNRTMRAIKILHHLARHNSDSLDEVDNSTKVLNKGYLNKMTIDLLKPCEKTPHIDMDESYELTVGYVPVLRSTTIWGIIRGLETFSQMFYIVDKEVRINATKIKDSPKYKHRGILLDTARHYISVKNILITLDAMAMNKMNVLHWHITDDESFPYVSQKFPNLSEKGAFHPALVYDKKAVKKIIEYATSLGIRVIPEFDVPGHTRSWGNAFPEVLTQCYSSDNKPTGLGPLNPTLNTTYALLRDLYQEITSTFPDSYIHMGGDEIDTECWKSNPKIAHYLHEHQMDATDMIGLFVQNSLALVPEQKKVIVWQEIFDEDVHLPQDALVQVWQYDWSKEMFKILHAGHKLIFSSPWYLDIMTNNFVELYDYDPRQIMLGRVSSSLLNNIVGGEACMWGEFVDDTNIISRIWSRASAVAEVLWSDTTNLPEFADEDLYNRLEEHTCRMKRRGIAAQPGNGPSFCLTETNFLDHEETYNGW